jgi:outer membrane protein assembly factor BamB
MGIVMKTNCSNLHGPRLRAALCPPACGLLLTVATAWGLDWPNFHGPDHNNISRETGWFGAWPTEGPKQVWKASVGQGFSSMSVAGGRLYTMGVVDKQETVWCLNALTGEKLWSHAYPYVFKPQYYEGGSSATPTVDGDRVYSLGQAGELRCFDAASGQVLWSQNIASAHGLAVPTWGFAGSPHVQGNVLLLNAGTYGLALDKTTGKLVWTTGKTAAGYSSMVAYLHQGRKAVALFAAKEVVGVEVATGTVLWKHPWKTDWDVNAADPVVRDGRVFISSTYKAGCAMVQFDPSPPKELWRHKEMQNHFNMCVLMDGCLYGVDGEAEKPAFFKCLDWSTGQVKWSYSGLGLGSVMAADGKLIILSEKGELVVAEPSPAAFKALARAQVLGGKCWTTLVLANGKIYCRNSKGDLVCVNPKP